MCPRRKAVAEFRLTSGHDYLLKQLHRIHVAQAPFCTLCDFREDMDADLIRCCPVLKGSSLCDFYWQARDLLSLQTFLTIFIFPPLFILPVFVFVPTPLPCVDLL
ncbi:hypothetical protein TNCV_1806591 [Trichonephila clavipes]|nr:hypothetical protein TNCV_1806591 [Trichonephila clavipes]